MTLIIGSEGSMGQRYQAILKYLKIPFECYDQKTGGRPDFSKYSHFVICTPTETHFRWVQTLDEYGRPILCEKPLAKDRDEWLGILACQSPLSMMMQYRFFNYYGVGASWYDYFRHGKDGLAWDCFQIIALAQGVVRINEESPIWTCGLNGMSIDLGQMDRAYIWAVREFYNGQYLERETMRKWHDKIIDFKESCKWTTQPSA